MAPIVTILERIRACTRPGRDDASRNNTPGTLSLLSAVTESPVVAIALAVVAIIQTGCGPAPQSRPSSSSPTPSCEELTGGQKAAAIIGAAAGGWSGNNNTAQVLEQRRERCHQERELQAYREQAEREARVAEIRERSERRQLLYGACDAGDADACLMLAGEYHRAGERSSSLLFTARACNAGHTAACEHFEKETGREVPVEEARRPRAAVAPSNRLLIFGGRNHDVFLGCLTCSEFDLDSVHNEHGKFGGKYYRTSIHNEYGDYGSKYAATSACNELATDPPVVVDEDGGFYGALTLNEYARGAIGAEKVVEWLRAVCASD